MPVLLRNLRQLSRLPICSHTGRAVSRSGEGQRGISSISASFWESQGTLRATSKAGASKTKQTLQSVRIGVSCLRTVYTSRITTSSITRQTRRMASRGAPAQKHRVCIVGSGNWGTTIAKVVAENTQANPDLFEKEVQMWVFEEEYQIPQDSKHYDSKSELSTKPQKLTALINGLHENVKYLPEIALPHNLIANPDIVDAVKDATILVFNLPHQFIGKVCEQLQGKIVPYARGISCIKGVAVDESGCELFSESIGNKLGIYCGALSGANIATEVALEKFSETTVAYERPAIDSRDSDHANSAQDSSKDRSNSQTPQQDEKSPTQTSSGPQLHAMPATFPALNHTNMRKLFHRPYFHVRMVDDVAGVSLGGALKNIVALSAGFVDGLGWGDNAKAAVMRVGIQESVKFGKTFFAASHVRTKTFTEESCGVADLITSCSGGRNFRCAKMSIQEGKPIGEIEERELNGQKLQGTSTAYEVNSFLRAQGRERDFPLFTAVYNILEGKNRPEEIPDMLLMDEENREAKRDEIKARL